MDQSFLDIGRHCSEESCRQLDFLPFKCPSCSLPFCSIHWRPPSGHACPSYDPSLYDNRVPSCPLCSSPVPPLDSRSQDPNRSMDHHLEHDCDVLHPERRRDKLKASADNECQVAKCRTKLVVEIKCDQCRGRYCPKHRFERDHSCDGGESYRKRLAEEQARARQNRSGKGFGGLFRGNNSNSSSSMATTKTNAVGHGDSKPVSSRDRVEGIGQAGLAALRRAQQQAATKTTDLLERRRGGGGAGAGGKSAQANDSDSSIEIVSHKPASSSRADAPASAGERPNAAAPPPPPTATTKTTATNRATSKRAKAEQASARKALEARYEKGLLSEAEKLKFAELRAQEAKDGGGAKEKDGCRVM